MTNGGSGVDSTDVGDGNDSANSMGIPGVDMTIGGVGSDIPSGVDPGSG